MITYSSIQKSQLEGAIRLDAEYYQPEYLELMKRLEVLPIVKLSDIAYITDGEHGSPIFDETSEIKYFSAQHVRDGFIDGSDAKSISKIIDDRNKRSRLQIGDILLSTVGTIGFAGLVTEDLLPANIDRHVARIALKDKTIYPGFLVAFLNSAYGKFQTIRESTGNVQLNLFIDKIKKLKIPKINAASISNLINTSLEESKNSKEYFRNAENLLLEELGIKDLQVEDDVSYVVNLSDIKSANRVDAEHFQLKYDKLIAKIKNQNLQPLLKVIENVPARFNPVTKPDTVFHYVELADINASIGIVDGCSDVSGKEAPSRAKRLLRKGDVIVSSVEGSLEKVALVRDYQDGYLASTGFFQFRSKELLPEVILVLAKSMVMQWQLQKYCAGTILTAVPGDSLQKMFTPVISEPMQQKIADLVRQSHEARKKSKALLEEAKRKVEEMIEKRKN